MCRTLIPLFITDNLFREVSTLEIGKQFHDCFPQFQELVLLFASYSIILKSVFIFFIIPVFTFQTCLGNINLLTVSKHAYPRVSGRIPRSVVM